MAACCRTEYATLHHDILAGTSGSSTGTGSLPTVWERLGAADTLVYIDLPLAMHYCGCDETFDSGLFREPKGWPKNSPVCGRRARWLSVIGLCHRRLTPKYRQYIAEAAARKQIRRLRSRAAMKAFLQAAANGRGTS